jgi:hypothetical protein
MLSEISQTQKRQVSHDSRIHGIILKVNMNIDSGLLEGIKGGTAE